MRNLKKYNSVFMSVFNANESDLKNEFSVSSVDNWDSITQLSLITEIEDEFDIMFDTNDILEFRSYKIGKELLLKYNIKINEV